jgi:hypothetical protein
VGPLLSAACLCTRLNASADIEADNLAGRSPLWMAWNGRTIEVAVATVDFRDAYELTQQLTERQNLEKRAVDPRSKLGAAPADYR